MAGGGAQDAGDAILQLAERLNAPVAMTQSGLGTIDSRHRLAYSQVGAHHWWRRADVVLGLATRLYPAAATWGRDDNLDIIRIDIDAGELDKLPTPVDGIHGEVSESVGLLCDALDRVQQKAAAESR